MAYAPVIVPGLATMVGVLGGLLGPLARLGLLAYGGVLAYADWQDRSVARRSVRRLRSAVARGLSGAFAWITEVGLPKLNQ